MKFYSTNNKDLNEDFRTALFKGMPSDKGLYMPRFLPDLSKLFNKENKMSFRELSFEISKKFLDEDLSKNQIQNIIESCITFDAPNKKIEKNLYCLELFHGPTLAFKDFGARFMAQCMQSLRDNSSKEINILVATSGDTGGAVANGFYDVDGINVIILYPKGKVSEIQEKQLTTLDKNVFALEVDGTFDDCQKLVKKAFLDDKLNEQINLSSANSINIARLIPQSFYYAHSYMQLDNKKLPAIFSVPCGNFGNITAGLLIKKMGLPLEKIIASTNSNDVIPKFLETGKFSPKPSIQTISNAMDVGNPSNIVRIMDLYQTIEKLKMDMISWSFNEIETSNLIKEFFIEKKYILDPHTSVALLGILKYEKKQSQNFNKIFLGTAHPAKFIDVVEKNINCNIKLPKRLNKLLSLEKKSVLLKNNYDEFYDYLLSSFQ